jgi:predicted amidophosphoribosyltransferase
VSPRKRQTIVKKIEELERDLGKRVAVYFGPGLDEHAITFDDIIQTGEEIRRLYRQLREADAE